MKIAYFAPELADPAVRRRVGMLTDARCAVNLLGFARDRGAGAPDADGYVLGHTQNRKFVQRIFSVLGAIPRALALRRLWRDADVVLARNLEMLALVVLVTLIMRPRARIAYECLDIHRLMSSPGIAGRVLRAIERACLRRSAIVVTSSPAFEQHHFRQMQGFAGDIILAENKILPLAEAAPSLSARPEGPPWVIAWCGVLRCRKSLDLLRKLANETNGDVRVDLWGAPALDQIPTFHDLVAGAPNMAFHGRYEARDLPAIYGRAHFAWTLDFYEAGGNSDWLLPNRLYESLAFGAVPLAVAGVETARWLSAKNVGLVFDASLERALSAFFLSLTPQAYEPFAMRVRALDQALLRETPDTCRAFAARLAGRKL